MSRYLVDRIEAHDRIQVRNRAEVTEARGDERLGSVVIRDESRGEEIEAGADALFVMIGAQPMTAGVEGWLRRDDHGFLVTGPDLLATASSARGRSTARRSTSSRASQASSSPATYATARSSASPPRSAKARWQSRSSTST